MDFPVVHLQSQLRLWWVCPSCGQENEARQNPVSADDMRAGLGVEPWRGDVPVQEGFTVPDRDRCRKCETIVSVRDNPEEDA